MKTKFAIVVSRYNQSITERLLKGALKTFKENKIEKSDVKIIWVPGAFEIPLIAEKLAKTKKYNAILCLGCVLKGETLHNHYISDAVSKEIMHIALKTGIPVIFGVLTPNTKKQAIARSGNDSANKGTESAEAALELVKIMKMMDDNDER